MAAFPLPLTGGDPYKNTNKLALSIILIALQHSITLYTNKQSLCRTNPNHFFLFE